MADDKRALVKQALNDVLQKIAGEHDGLDARMDYIVPTTFQINPHTFEPYVSDSNKSRNYLMDLCIGKRVGKEIMPGVCINVLPDFGNNVINAVHTQAHSIKSIHPQARYGLIFFGISHIPKGIIHPTSNDVIHIDFIEAMKDFIDCSDKVFYFLKETVDVQLKSSDNIASALFGDNKVRSMRKAYY